VRPPAEHDAVFDPQAVCYMLSNGAVNNHLARHPGANLLDDGTFFRFLLGRALSERRHGANDPAEAVFNEMREHCRALRSESLSGAGASLWETRELRQRLPLLLQDLGVTSLLDAGCGDFNWMQHVDLGIDAYIGVDLLADLVADNDARC